MAVSFHSLADRKLKYVVIAARHRGQWIMVQHHQRDTWEIPGGHIELGETPDVAAKRELFEESGAESFHIEAICDYGVTRDGVITYGRFYFADVDVLGQLPESEISKVEPLNDHMKWTYDWIQPLLFEKVNTYLTEKDGC